ncbi:MAG: AAA family ATPase, partial [Vicinamibacterales bacterium]
PCLVAIGGLSGSGKSTVALRMAPEIGAAPGALVARSDEVRKRLAGVPLLSRLGSEGYDPESSRRVYSTAAAQAAAAVRAGHSAIVDAVFAQPTDRAAIEGVAAAEGAPFVGLWLEAPESILIERAQQRQRDPSDADAAVIRMQLANGTGHIGWRHIDASRAVDAVVQEAIARVEAQRGS